jgi:pimeloyl-ACP methyl ester carboxylesterase
VALPANEFSQLAHVHLTVLPGVGHTPPWEAAHYVAELITTAACSRTATHKGGETRGGF